MFEAVDDRQVAVHEIGHALILLSCGVDEFVELTHVELTPTDPRRAGVMGIAMAGFPSGVEGLSVPLDRDAAASVAMTYAGGAVAERTMGYELDMSGMFGDISRMGVLISYLSGASLLEVECTHKLHNVELEADDLEWRKTCEMAYEHLDSAVKMRCGRSIEEIQGWLGYEVDMRLSCSKPAIQRLSDALLERGRLEGDEIRELLRKTHWCGVIGSPVATAFFKETWPSQNVLDILEGAQAED